ncbi:MAG: class I SAM-dependent methyltransferase [Magnetovibrionaceae bacterium]
MWNDVVELRDFYDDRLGLIARRMIRRRIRDFWPDVTGRRVLGIGYAAPYLGLFRDEAERMMALMPPRQGVLHWPVEGVQQVCLADECQLPFPDLSVDLILMVHAMECAETLRPMMREVWRVLAASGRLLVVVPNRRGLWSRLERTPFGMGRPYSRGQLKRTLRDCLFTPTRTEHALFVPPTRYRLVLSAAAAWEELGQRWMTGAAGVVLAEAVKEIYAGVSTEQDRAGVFEGAREQAARLRPGKSVVHGPVASPRRNSRHINP